ncbi:hypothetical protein [Pantoea sp. UBA5037]|uniref:hypothetical protein n=1 Tax=Pantoea sp. UBA5037 TaxID=1947036 RepID=UPI00257CD6C4|nr:hypothetical protein [Pantoea sp. UBA5037]
MNNEYQIAIFGTVIKSQNGLFRLDEIRREGISIGKVEDTESTMYKRFAQTKVGKLLVKGQKIRLLNMGQLGVSVLAAPVAACEFARWLDFEYGLAVSEAFMEMTHSEAIQEAVAVSAMSEPVKAFVAEHKETERDNFRFAMASLKKLR